jgi:hypothetical protein
MRFTFALILIVTLLATAVQAGVSQATFLFLRIAPSAQANGRSFGIVPGNYYDPLAPWYNPAAQGFMAKQNRFSGALSYAQWLPGWNISDLYVLTGGMNAGIASERGPKLWGKRGMMYYGAGMQFLYLNLGETQRVDEQARPLGSFTSNEWAGSISLGAMMDHYVRLGIGLTGKVAYSKLGSDGGSKASAPVMDTGLILEVPVLKPRQALPGSDAGSPGVEPEVLVSFNYALLNIGGKVAYEDYQQADPLPRTAALGLAVTAALSRDLPDGGSWRWLYLSVGVDANDELVRRDHDGTPHYRCEPFGDINLLTDFIAAQNDRNYIKSYGTEIGLWEAFFLRTGYYSNPEGNVYYNAYGTGLHLGGLLKSLRSLRTASSTSLAASLKGWDLSYDLSVYDTHGSNDSLDETLFHMLTFRLEY